MMPLTTANSFALSILMDDDIYVLPDAPPAEILLAEPMPEISAISVDKTSDIPEKQKDELQYFGQKGSKNLILVRDAENPVCAAEERPLFKNICTAMNWTATDYMIVNMQSNPSYTLAACITQLQPQNVILFGLDAEFKAQNFSLNHLFTQDDISIIATQSLALLNQNKTYKLQFWNELKKIK